MPFLIVMNTLEKTFVSNIFQSTNHAKSIINGDVLYCKLLFQSGNSGLMEEKAKNEGTALALYVVKCQVYI